MKQQRYLDKDGKRDWIDKCADEMTLVEFNAAMFFTIGKYYQRLGKKDPVEQELAKAEDYHLRWVDKLVSKYKKNELWAIAFADASIERAKALASEE